ncbi:MAG TPA: urease accessory UreF family protein, partial [Arenibaculum sp.]|nr:urease accessory UreF family protein [Arenibaculum sp.]
LGGGWTDAVLFVESWRAAMAGDRDRLLGVADLAEALAPSRERHLETMAQGTAFLAGVCIWPCRPVEDLCDLTRGRAAYPVAVAAAAAGHGIPIEDALPLHLNAFAANLISVAVRLVPLGQTAGLSVLAGLQPLLLDVSRRAGRTTLDDLGSSAIISDIAAMRHEQQYSRTFRT